MTEAALDSSALDALPAADLRDLLRPACASDAWLGAMAAGRPYADLDALWARSDSTIGALSWPDVEQALAAHPRIGERATGTARESSWSREEQAGAASAGDDVAAALHTANVDYERRFGTVFLVCATGRTPEQILAALHERLDNEVPAEQRVVRRELAAIARLRLARIVAR